MTSDDKIKAVTVYGIGVLDDSRLSYEAYKRLYLDPILRMWDQIPRELRGDGDTPAMSYQCWRWAVSRGLIDVDGGACDG